MGMNKEMIGQTYPPKDMEVTAEATKKYAAAYDDDNPWFHDEGREGGIIAPPMFTVVYSTQGMAQGIMDGKLGMNFATMVHGEQKIRWLKPVKPGDKISTAGRIHDITDKSSGQVVQLSMTCTNQDGERVAEALVGLFVRGGGHGKKGPKMPPADLGEPVATWSKKVEDDQMKRYAEASGDHNPIHIDADFAKKVGLPDVIMHGLCNMCYASKALMENCCDNDPTKLKMMSLQFSKPVLKGQTVTVSMWDGGQVDDRKIVLFESKTEDGSVCIKDGVAEVLA
jgi:acyl dehydratase